LLSPLTAQSLVRPDQQLVKLSTTTSVGAALKVLAEKRILSAPVWDEAQKKDVGFFDVLDFVGYLQDHGNVADNAAAAAAAVFATEVVKLVNYSRRDPTLTVSGKTSLFEVVQRMDKMRVHRLAVTDDKGIVGAVVTQSSVIAFAATHLLEHVSLSKRIGDTGIGTWPVVAVYDTDSTWEAFRKIRSYNLSAVGVIDHDQRLLGSISSADLRGITEESFNELKLSTGEYLARRRDTTANASTASPPPPPSSSSSSSSSSFYSIKPSLPVGEVIATLYKYHLHRLFVVDEQLKPLRVITLSDIIALLASS